MTEEKTKLQWFEDYLPADVAALAINNTEELRLNEQSESLDDALHEAFVWAKTDQGHKFWDNIANTKSRWMEASIELCELEECGSCDGIGQLQGDPRTGYFPICSVCNGSGLKIND